MEINKFIRNFRNHPVLFIGSGMSLRYMENSYTWEGLLNKITSNISRNENAFINLKMRSYNQQLEQYDFPQLASLINMELNNFLENYSGDDPILRATNERFYNMASEVNYIDRIQVYISILLETTATNPDMKEEIDLLKEASKNVSSIITTNYDDFIEKHLGFSPLIGNDILLSNPYGSVYKIHGCVTKPRDIIITKENYNKFEEKYKLIRAQLISLFIHNPIIFLGYSLTDTNIKAILETIFTYVNYSDELSEKIRSNFLLVEYDAHSMSTDVTDHDITTDQHIIKINKIKTNNYSAIYKSLKDLILPISAMDVRKVETVLREIYKGGSSKRKIKINIKESIDELENSDKVLMIGTPKYPYESTAEIMEAYFSIVDDNNSAEPLDAINLFNINKNQYFPIFAFSKMPNSIAKIDNFKETQITKIKNFIKSKNFVSFIKNANNIKNADTISDIFNNNEVAVSMKNNFIVYKALKGELEIDQLKDYLLNFENYATNGKKLEATDYKRILCIYDILKYASEDMRKEITII